MSQKKCQQCMTPSPSYLWLAVCLIVYIGCSQSEDNTEPAEPDNSVTSAPREITSVESATEFATEEINRFYDGMVSANEETRIAAVDRVTPTKDELVALFGAKTGEKAAIMYQKGFKKIRENTAKAKEQFEGGGKITQIEVSYHDQKGVPFQTDENHSFPKHAYFFSDSVTNSGGGGGGAMFYVVLKGRLIYVPL